MPVLNNNEKASVAKALGKMASSMHSTIARIFICTHDDNRWRYSGIWGIVVAVFDRQPPASRHIKILDFNSYDVRFSHEIYENLTYHVLDPTFHAFEIESCMVGLQFCDAVDASDFSVKVRGIIPAAGSNGAVNTGVSANSMRTERESFFSRVIKSAGGTMLSPGKVVEVGTPTAFQHNVHIGYDSDNGFDIKNLPPEWKKIFAQAGISKKQLTEPATAAVIFETLQTVTKFPDDDEASHSHSAPVAPPLPTHSSSSSAPPPPVAPPLAPPVAPPMAPPLAPALDAPPAPPLSPSAPAPPAPPLAPSSSSSSSSSSTSLADALAHVQLKKATPHTRTESALPDVSALSGNETSSLANLLKGAMASKFKAVHQESYNDDDPDDWD